MNKRVIIGILLSIIGIISITIGISYSFYNYVKGNTESKKITFLYTEVLGVGNGISLIDAFPISDEIGKQQTREGKFFDFTIICKGSIRHNIPYEITVRKSKKSTLEENIIKLYLTELINQDEQELLLDKFNLLKQTEKIESEKHIEKTIYQGEILANEQNYQKNFRLRLWIDANTETNLEEDENYYYDKNFTVIVNVYANGAIVTNEERQ